MKNKTILFIAALQILLCVRSSDAQFQYISPMPNGKYRNAETNIILKNGSLIDKSSLSPSLVSLNGSISGQHDCRVELSDDNKTILIYPTTKFAEGETVFVSIADGFKKITGEIITGTSFSFQTHLPRTDKQKEDIQRALQYAKNTELGHADYSIPNEGTLREDCSIIPFTLTSTSGAYDAEVFYRNFRANDPVCFGRTIITNTGDSVYAAFDNEIGVSFTINKNGYITYYNREDSSFEMIDSTYTLVKKFFMGNGYFADEHEFLIFPDGHHFMFCYDVQPDVDLTAYGGLDSVDVIGLVLQELDASDNVIFEWNAWDHFLITDAVWWTEILLPSNTTLDWIHCNSIELDYDDNLLISSRHLCEITKIDRSTGEIIWRMGGDNNQFTFVNDTNDPLKFSGQHDFRLLPSGNYTLFNNGNNVQPLQSNAKEYQLDQVNKVATLVWSYAHPDVGGSHLWTTGMGNVQRLPNGNTFINWGFVAVFNNSFPRFTEVDSAGNIVWEFNFADTTYYNSYRAFKFKWDRCGTPPDSTFSVNYISADSVELSWGSPNQSSGFLFQYKPDTAANWITIPLSTNFILLTGLEPESVYQWQVLTICDIFPDTSDYSSIQEFTTISTLSGNSSANLLSLDVYPNPASGHVTVSFEVIESKDASCVVMNMIGEVVQQYNFKTNPGINKKVLDVSILPAGTYFIEFKSSDTALRERFIIH